MTERHTGKSRRPSSSPRLPAPVIRGASWKDLDPLLPGSLCDSMDFLEDEVGIRLVVTVTGVSTAPRSLR